MFSIWTPQIMNTWKTLIIGLYYHCWNVWLNLTRRNNINERMKDFPLIYLINCLIYNTWCMLEKRYSVNALIGPMLVKLWNVHFYLIIRNISYAHYWIWNWRKKTRIKTIIRKPTMVLSLLQARLGPKTTARLAAVILFMSHLQL